MRGSSSATGSRKIPTIGVRRFGPDDAEFCFRTRAHAFIVEFYPEVGPEVVAAGVNAHMPRDYVRMARGSEFFIVEEAGTPVGFFVLKRVDRTTAEIALIYLSVGARGKGIGRWCVQQVEERTRSAWAEVATLFLETIVPEYNGAFYRNVGFTPVAETVYSYPDLEVRAVRYEKRLRP
jgi:GNAT superfamily N-acetyltransferase